MTPFDGAKITELLDKWSLDKDKCAMVIRDGASNAVKGVFLVGVPHMSCIAHSLQLVPAGSLMRVRKQRKFKDKPIAKASKHNSESTQVIEAPDISPTSCPNESERARAYGATETITAILHANRSSAIKDEDSETDNDDAVADTGVTCAALERIREDLRAEVDEHVTETATTQDKEALDKCRAKVAIFRRVATYLRRSPKAKNRLNRIQFAKGKKQRGAILDCPTRWSSTHAMLKRFEKIKEELEGFFSLLAKGNGSGKGKAKQRDEFSDAVLKELPRAEDWLYLRCLRCLLQPFADVTKRLSGEKYPTFILVYPYLRMLKQFLQTEDLFEDDETPAHSESFAADVLYDMHRVREVLLHLFCERFDDMDETLIWVPLLDPRIADMSYLDKEKDKAQDCLIEAMVEIEQKKTPISPRPQPVGSSFFSPQRPKQSVVDAYDARLYGTMNQQIVESENVDRSQQIRTACTAEALKYLSMAQGPKPTEKPLEWWKLYGSQFPVISELARKWLGCVATSVPSERAFSTAGNVVTVKRAALTPAIVEDLTLLGQNKKRL